MFTGFCSIFIPETIHQILSKSPEFCRRYYEELVFTFEGSYVCANFGENR